MNKISLNWNKNNKGKYDFSIVQNGIIMFEKAYTPNIEKGQDTLFGGFVEFLQREVDEELTENPEFNWTNINEFKSWVTAYRKDKYLAELDAKEQY